MTVSIGEDLAMDAEEMAQVEQLREALRSLPRPDRPKHDIRDARVRRADSLRFKALCALSLRWQRVYGGKQ